MKKEPQKILIIRLSSIGDILLTTPLLRLLKKRFPQAEIGFVIKMQFYDLVRTNKNIDRIYCFDAADRFPALKSIKREIRNVGYDLIIDIHKNFRSYFLRTGHPGARVVSYPKYRLKRFLLIKFGWNLYRQVIPVQQRYLMSIAEFGVPDDGAGLDFCLDPAVQEKIDGLLKSLGVVTGRLAVCLAPGAGFTTKRWLPEYFTDVARCLIDEKKAQIILLGNEKDRVITREIAGCIGSSAIDLAGQFDLMETACALAHADLLISNDTGLMHLATALKIKTVAIFGPTTKELGFYPVSPLATVVENLELNCRPCTHIGSNKCPKRHFRCMKDIEPEKVFKAAINLLGE